MKPTHYPRILPWVLLIAAAGLGSVSVEAAQRKKSNPASKVYITDVAGEAVIDTGENLQEISERSVYAAQGTVIETKRPTNDADRTKYFSTMVYSNGTGAFFDADTRVEVKRFVQEPFTPNRTDIDIEPSVSQTQAFISRGAVGLCTSKPVAGSSMVYQTPHGSVNIRGRKVVIEATPQVTKISMLEGDSTVQAGAMDMGGHTVHAGEQAIIRARGLGEPNQIEIVKIPPAEAPQLDDKVAMACLAKKTVYFEIREKKDDGASGSAAGSVSAFTDDGKDQPGAVELVPVAIVPINQSSDVPLSTFEIPPSGK